ncbi:hypothetical protein [Pseudooceanicola sp. HF7]|uniref:hypothetical protein n=1 Tax=Pseudooceanicola sp. HF7 TaxID=2721560 RepID=UPI0014306E6A|nr:hypothetical protein [Pseudooceanicola sp. HF7]NIZ10166.1 hypothetical protein [Pseudooceanicola sp. HF7]
MKRPIAPERSPHEAILVCGMEAVDAYEGGERRFSELNRIGAVRCESFQSREALEAFLLGVQIATDWLDTVVTTEIEGVPHG